MVVDKCNVLSCEYKYCKCFIPQRWLGVVINMFSIIMAYGMRCCTTIAIVGMVKNTTETASKSKCVAPVTIIKHAVTRGDNDWNQHVQGWVLAGFYIGYVPIHFPAGAIADKLGSRWVLSTGMLASTICCLLIPIAADSIGYVAVILLRVGQGFGQGVIYPAMSANMGRWIPHTERATASSVGFSGGPIGSFLAILLSGFIMTLFSDWRWIYYFWGVISLVLYVVIIMYYYSDPDFHPHLTQRETDYLKLNTVARIKVQKTPYWRISIDGAVIATVIGETGQMFPMFFFATNVPKYLDQVLRLDVAKNSISTALPYLTTLVTALLGGSLADWLINKKGWDRGGLRKIYSVLSNAIPGVFLLAIGYAGCNEKLAILFIVLSMMFMGAYFPGVKTNTLDLTTHYAGFAMAWANGISAVAGILVPLLCGYLAPDNTVEQWNIVFWIMGGCCSLSTILFILLASGKRRRWDYSEEEQKFFVGKVPWFTLRDGIDKDSLAIEAGRAAETETNPGNPGK